MNVDPYLNHVYLKPGNYINPILKDYRAKSGIHNTVFLAIDLSTQLYEGYCRQIHDYRFKNLKGNWSRGQKKSMMAPKFISKNFATTIHTGKFKVEIENSEVVSELFKKVMKDNDLFRNWQSMTESGLFAVGGYVEKPYVSFDNDGIKSVYLDFFTHKNFVPISFMSNKISSAAIVSDSFKVEKKWYTTVEEHTKEVIVEGRVIYKIDKKLFEAESWNEKGLEVPWSKLFDDEPFLVFENMEGYTFFNYTRSGVTNALSSISPLGTPATADSIEAFEVLDTMFDTFYKEGLYGKISIDVPESALKMVVDPSTGAMYEYFDHNSEIHKGFKQSDGQGISNAPKINAVPLRIHDFIAAINIQLKIVAIQMGLSPGTYSFDGQSMKTATEVITEQSETFKTKVNYEQRLRESYERFIKMIVGFAYTNDIISSIPTYEVSVIFDDSIVIDDQKEFENNMTLFNAGSLSKETLLKENKKWTDDETQEELLRIKAEESEMFDDSVDDSTEEEFIDLWVITHADEYENAEELTKAAKAAYQKQMES